MDCQAGSVMLVSSTMLMLDCAFCWRLAMGSLGLGMEASWCWYLAAQEEVDPQLYADNLQCVSRDFLWLLRAAEFTIGYVI